MGSSVVPRNTLPRLLSLSSLTSLAILTCHCGSEASARWQGGSGAAPESVVDASAGVDGPPGDGTCIGTLVQSLEPDLNACRVCHAAGEVAAGTRFLLTANAADDERQLRASWGRLESLLLSVPSEADGGTHTGGDVLPAGGTGYRQMSALLAAFADPTACIAPGDAGTDARWPLLGSAHGGHVWNTFCVGKSDDTPLPADPRSLVQPGVNAGKATYFNAFWVDCHDGPDGGADDAGGAAGGRAVDGGVWAGDVRPKTCGDYRSMFAQGRAVVVGGQMTFFGGDYTDSLLDLTADQYNSLWQRWGLPSRPADFDRQVANRWGMPIGTAPNPYPLPGEDPAKTGGGSGQLPLGLTQVRDANGVYSGKIGLNCNWCHSGQVGDPSDGPGLGPLYGNGNSLVEIGAAFNDFIPGFPIAANKVRGTGDILLYPAIAALDVDKADHYNGALVASPAGGSVDFPVWWNVGHRTRRFWDGSFAMDDARPVMGFAMPIASQSHLLDIAGGREWIAARAQVARLWIEALTAPNFPGSIDTKLAEAGAILFHDKNLWAPDLDNPAPAPDGGNGSCAGCHGVYSPRYSHDTNYLDTPDLEGMASYVVPITTIGTDAARYNSLDDGLKQNLQWTWWAYGTDGTPGRCFGGEPPGYLAPPLYGVWATAPYFHNGSVPNVWEVLKPSDRKAIWRRVSAPPPATNPSEFTDFDTNLLRAYDFEKLGWKYDELQCADGGSNPALDCTPGQQAETTPAGQIWFTWNLQSAPSTADQLQQRKIYNTYMYSQGNRGHEFTSVLTDDERRALIEYLKTL